MMEQKPVTLAELNIAGKIFCLSMQRSGTLSVGTFLAQWGLKHGGYPLSRSRNWTRHWFNGNYEAIFSDRFFSEYALFEDDPWWCPEFYRCVFHRVPGSRFILLTRDADAWFKSMIRHSNGYTLGNTDIHAKIYRRESDLEWLENNVHGFKRGVPQGMTIFDKASHYKETYERHTREVRRYFEEFSRDSLFCAELGTPGMWEALKSWLNLPDRDGVDMEVHTHKSRGVYTRQDLLKRQHAK